MKHTIVVDNDENILVPRAGLKRRIPLGATEGNSDYLQIIPLGAGQEVGRSCIILKYKGKCVMLDCGLHPAFKGAQSMPYLDNINIDEIDLLLVTHFHLDHSACLPYFLEKTNFSAPCFMTHPTKSIYKLILQDFIKVSTLSIDDKVLFGEKELNSSMDKIQCIDFHMDKVVNGIRFKAFHAGHVLGAAMFIIQIANVKILYTGDYSCDDDRHLKGAELPNEKPDVLIIESTFGRQTLSPVSSREREFTRHVHDIVRRGGRCLIPVFALGRAQELLLILDEYWSMNSSLHRIPIYYASALAKKCLQVYSTYIGMMHPKMQQQYQIRNPFEFRHVTNLKGRYQFRDDGPSVVFASPGMLQNGLSRELFELWCSDRKNGLVIPGYAVEGTMAKEVQHEPSHIDSLRGGKLPLRMSVHYVMFAAHADHHQTKQFIRMLKPTHVILVHGERTAMSRVKKSLEKQYYKDGIQISSPANCQAVEIEFRKDKKCKVIGSLCEEHEDLKNGDIISGVLVRKEDDYTYHLTSSEDLSKYTSLQPVKIQQSLMIPFQQSFTALGKFIARIYDIRYIRSEKHSKKNVIVINPTLPYRSGNGNNNNNNNQSNQKTDQHNNNGHINHTPTFHENELGNDEDEIRIYKHTRRTNYNKSTHDGDNENNNDSNNNNTINTSSSAHGYVQIKWMTSPLNDFIVDSVIALIVSVDSDSNGGVAQSMMQKCKSKHGVNLEEESNAMPSAEAFFFILDQHFGKNNVHLVSGPNSNNNNIDVSTPTANPTSHILKDNLSSENFASNQDYSINTEENNNSFPSQESFEKKTNKKIDDIVYKIVLHGKEAIITFRHNIPPVYGYKDKVHNRKATFKVESEDGPLKQRIESILRHMDSALYPIHKEFDCQKDFELPIMPTLDPPKPLSSVMTKPTLSDEDSDNDHNDHNNHDHNSHPHHHSHHHHSHHHDNRHKNNNDNSIDNNNTINDDNITETDAIEKKQKSKDKKKKLKAEHKKSKKKEKSKDKSKHKHKHKRQPQIQSQPPPQPQPQPQSQSEPHK